MNDLLRRIYFARDWLDKAEARIRSDDLVEGGFFLSLAEAEIRRAWENSTADREKSRRSDYLRPLLLISVLGLIVLTVVTGFSYFNHMGSDQALTLEPVGRAPAAHILRSDLQLTGLHNGEEPRLLNVDLTIDTNHVRGK